MIGTAVGLFLFDAKRFVARVGQIRVLGLEDHKPGNRKIWHLICDCLTDLAAKRPEIIDRPSLKTRWRVGQNQDDEQRLPVGGILPELDPHVLDDRCAGRLVLQSGRKGGLKGGKARAAGMTAEQRKDAARKAAQARWGKKG